MDDKRKYAFSWDLIGDITMGRPNLGNQTRLEVYRLMQLTFRDILEQRYGTKEADTLFYQAGELSGREFYKHLMKPTDDLNEFIRQLHQLLIDLGIGILRVEKADMEKGELELTVSEDLDCSGLPDIDEVVCTYDEGFIAGLLESFTGTAFKVKEIDCWCTGDRTCRFSAVASTLEQERFK
jgi:uncharacterized protein